MEAEWEYAFRAGTESSWFFGSNVGSLGKFAWFDGNSETSTHPVGTLHPNAWGLHDMAGNVGECCWDWYGTYLGPVKNPSGPESGTLRVYRGGSWVGDATYPRAAYRSGSYPGGPGGSNVGFRLCRSGD